MKNTKRKILIIVFALTVGYIWIHSMIPPVQSSAESGKLLDFIRPILEIFVGKGNATNNMVRKLAHFVEYGVLGIELALFIVAGWIKDARGQAAEQVDECAHGSTGEQGGEDAQGRANKPKTSAIEALCDASMRMRVHASIGIGFVIAFIDETIQIFSGRGPLITDVWLDTLGAAVGVLVVRLIVRVRSKTERN